MKNFKYIWVVGLIATIAIIAVPVVVFAYRDQQSLDNPRVHMPEHPVHTDHTSLIEGQFETGQQVTETCLTCHPDAANEVMATAHWTWLSDPVEVPWRDEPVATGKANLINNFCIGIQSNWTGCTKCHAGYGWDSAEYDFTDETSVDCLVCHDQSGTYVKANAGLPAEGVDLLSVAQGVGLPTRQNCGSCHFFGGGGDAVKHGDLDSSMTLPSENLDVHMGRYDFQCTDCHRTTDHSIAGRSITVSVDSANQIACTDCHAQTPHPDDRLNAHTDTVACQTCHIPAVARRLPTKVEWDWSTAGNDWPEDPHAYLKIKGSFIYEGDLMPEYAWFNQDISYRYLFGDPIDPQGVTVLNPPAGSIDDPNALIWPFKIHHGNQPYDLVYNYLLQPKTVGEFWVNFDWEAAFHAGAEAVGLPYSGQYGFARTDMYWPITHMVAPAEDALQCAECHGANGRLDWEALGYPGDPIEWGGREALGY